MFASLQNKQKFPGLHFLLNVLTNAESAHTEQSFAKPVKNIYFTVQREEIIGSLQHLSPLYHHDSQVKF